MPEDEAERAVASREAPDDRAAPHRPRLPARRRPRRGRPRAGRSSSACTRRERRDGARVPGLRLRAVLPGARRDRHARATTTRASSCAAARDAGGRRRATSTRSAWPTRSAPARCTSPTPTATASSSCPTASPTTGAPGDRPPAPRRSAGFHPRKLGHVNSLTGDLARDRDFYVDVLGMRVTDCLGDGGHVAARQRRPPRDGARRQGLRALPPPRASSSTSLGELGVAFDHLAQHGRWLAWGPVRHGIGQNICGYVRIPEEECLVELYSDMEQLDADHEPREWPDDRHSSNTWGPLPPRSYFRFDAGGDRVRAREPRDPGPSPRTPGAALHGDHRVHARPGPHRASSSSTACAATPARSGSTARRSRTRSSTPSSQAAAHSIARVFDLQHEHADEMLAPAPDHGGLVNVTHLIPRTPEDLVRRRRAMELTASVTGGMMGRTPDYLNVTFACFAGARRRVGAARQRAGRREPRRVPEAHARPRPVDDALDHEPAGRPLEAGGRAGRGRGRAAQGRRDRRPASSCAARACWPRSRRSPTSCSVYPGSDIRPQDGDYALAFAIPMGTPGLKFICRDSFSKQRSHFDYPLSSRFDEMDAVAIFDDVEIPHERVFLVGDTRGLLRGHHRHRLAQPHHAPGLHAGPRRSSRSRFGLGHLHGGDHRRRPLRPHPGEARPDLRTWSS